MCKLNVSHGKETKKLCNNKRNKISSTKPLNLIKLVWQHVSTSEGNLQASSMKQVEGTVYYVLIFEKTQKLIQLHIQFILCILNYWPEDVPVN